MAVVGGDAERDGARLAEARAALARIAEEIRGAKAQLETVRADYVAVETALAEQRVRAQQAEREAQDAVFGEREVSAKIAEIDNSVRMIDQQIARADEEVGRLTAELAVDPVPAVREALAIAAGARMSCEKTLAGARDAVEAAAGVAARAGRGTAPHRKLAGAAARTDQRAAAQGAGRADQP